MVIIQPSRPKTKRIRQKQPHLVESDIGNISVTPVNTSVTASDRQTVLDSGFSSTYKTDFNWTFDPELILHPTRNEKSFTTLNGSDAIAITWKGNPSHTEPQATDDDRWGANIVLPLLEGFDNGYEEGWLTQDFKFVSPFSSPKGIKIIGVQPSTFPNSTGNCDGGWLFRLMLGRFSNGDSFTADRYGRSRYHSVDAVGNTTTWPDGAFIPLDTVIRIEQYFKLNTAFDQADGVLIHKYDVGTASAHATPETIRDQRTNFRMYCGSEANRNGAKAKQIRYHVIFGGNDSTWWPNTDSQIIFGRVKFEIPA